MEESQTKRTIRLKTGDEVEIPEGNILRVVDGLLGFPDLEEYALVPHGGESPFFWLQSVREEGLAFIVIDPRLFVPDYLPKVSSDDLAAVELERIEEAVVLAVVVIPEDPRKMTANLQGPLIINPRKRLARQVISQDPQHPIRYYIVPQEDSGEKG
ncbi:MAG: flagellar assembly protein FliW [Candidatus Hydrogenedentota bacterium]|nr:MAG: flagellar assembly protein FliW [Candidatus Hydrogenedentota bacterium]